VSEEDAKMARLLIVEDNDMNGQMLCRRLTRRGFEVALAVDGQQAIDLAHDLRPDLILMDMALPVLDGWQATQALKSAPATRGIPIIALTAHAMAEDRQRALLAGCDDYQTKPIDLPKLLERISDMLGDRPAHASKEEPWTP
jgi:CheY-like chemotaxis protein